MGLLRPDQVALKWHDGRATVWAHGYTIEDAALRFFDKYDGRPENQQYVYVYENGEREGHIMLRQLRLLVAPDVRGIKPGAIWRSSRSPLIVSKRMKEVIVSWGL